MVLMEGASWDLSLLEKAEDSDFFIFTLSWEFDVDRPPDAWTELFIILTIIIPYPHHITRTLHPPTTLFYSLTVNSLNFSSKF